MEPYPQEVLETRDYVYPGNELLDDQVCYNQQINTTTPNTGLAHIKPVSAQILFLTDTSNRPIHIELENGATCSYIIKQEAIYVQYMAQ